MDNIIRIKCPQCGTVLRAKKIEGIESKNIPCQKCKSIRRFTEYEILEEKKIVKVASPVKKEDDGETKFRDGFKPKYTDIISKLTIEGSTTEYTLKTGNNIIGRKAKTSNANIQIETADMTMSRAHALIEMVMIGGECKHYLSNANNKNATYVNGELVEDDDKIILKDNAKIKMGNVTLKFSIDTGEETLFY